MFFFTFVTSYSIYIVVVVNIYVRDKVRKKKKTIRAKEVLR